YATLSNSNSNSASAGALRERSAASLQANARIGAGSLWFNHTRRELATTGGTATPGAFSTSSDARWRSTGIGYSRYEPALRGFFRASLSRVQDGARSGLEASVGLTFYLGSNQSVSASAGSGDGAASQSVQWAQGVPAQGWGHELTATRSSTQGSAAQEFRATTQLNAAQGVLRAEAVSSTGTQGAEHGLRLGAAGGMAWIDGRVYFGAPVNDAFAVVRVATLAGIPVSVNGEKMGVTDERGQVFVPSLRSLYGFDVKIDPTAAPMDWRLPAMRRRVALAPRSGATIAFEATRIQAVVGQLKPVGHEALPQLSAVTVFAGPTPTLSISGQDGTLYLENLPPGRHRGLAGEAAAQCAFWLEIPATNDPLIDLGEIACEKP
ncbi:MAG TPA: fimbria/pilus outer membrane usher protein, partial [Ramlibacter sp.]|nr:fimbria/pilus outer membrane usher protein [Ramlibacter sp.]